MVSLYCSLLDRRFSLEASVLRDLWDISVHCFQWIEGLVKVCGLFTVTWELLPPVTGFIVFDQSLLTRCLLCGIPPWQLIDGWAGYCKMCRWLWVSWGVCLGLCFPFVLLWVVCCTSCWDGCAWVPLSCEFLPTLVPIWALEWPVFHVLFVEPLKVLRHFTPWGPFSAFLFWKRMWAVAQIRNSLLL